MAPLLADGDSLRVRRCGPSELAPGDVALMREPDGRPFAHLVVSVAPLRTSTFSGALDPEGGRVVGRVEAVRRARVVFGLPRGLGPLVLGLHRVVRLTRGMLSSLGRAAK